MASDHSRFSGGMRLPAWEASSCGQFRDVAVLNSRSIVVSGHNKQTKTTLSSSQSDVVMHDRFKSLSAHVTKFSDPAPLLVH
jgi:hypothetical protein